MNSQPQRDLPVVTVRGRTAQEALSNVKRRYGPQAQILESREMSERSRDDLGERRYVEVDVVLNGMGDASGPGGVAGALAAEVARIESLVREIEKGGSASGADDGDATLMAAYPLSGHLLRAGATRPAVRQLARMWQADGDGGEPLEHLAGVFRASGGDWESFGGRHLLLGRPGAGKTSLILGAAARLRSLDRKVLVLSLGRERKGDMRWLQEEAREHGYDAAVLRKGAQLEKATSHFGGYDAVLMDAPALDDPFLADTTVRHLLADDEHTHRHMVVPVDADPSALNGLWTECRQWNCDWIALSRGDLAAHSGRLADLLLAAPCAVSLSSRGAWPGAGPLIPSSRQLVGSTLAGAATRKPGRTRGLAAKALEV